MSRTESLISELEQEAATTRRVLERIPEGELTWSPHPKSMTAGQLAVYLRLLDVPVPAVYGPSADEDAFA